MKDGLDDLMTLMVYDEAIRRDVLSEWEILTVVVRHEQRAHSEPLDTGTLPITVPVAGVTLRSRISGRELGHVLA